MDLISIICLAIFFVFIIWPFAIFSFIAMIIYFTKFINKTEEYIILKK